jgi:hypothetical protein
MAHIVKHVHKHLVDLFLDTPNPFPTGFEPSVHLRLNQRHGVWVQVSGTKIPSWQFKKIVGEL